MLFKVFLLLLVLTGGILPMQLIGIPLAMSLTGLVIGGVYFWQAQSKKPGVSWLFQHKSKNLPLQSPFELLPALRFGALFVAVLYMLYFAQQAFGDSGVYAAAVVSGLIDIDAIILSLIESLRNEEVVVSVAQNAIVIAVLLNTVIKAFYVGVIGRRALLQAVLLGTGVMAVVGGGMWLALLA